MGEQNETTQTKEVPTETVEPENIEIIDEINEKSESNLDDSNNESDEKVDTELEQLKAEKEQAYDKMLRLQAEFDNYKKRTLKDREAERKYKAQDMATDLLPVIDNFDRALQVEHTDESASFMEGMTIIYRQLKDVLKTQGVEEMDVVGELFDPTLHHAVMQVEDDTMGSNIVVEELQKGYMLKDRVIRPAMVKVNK